MKLNILLLTLETLPLFNPDSENLEFTKWFKKSYKYIEEIFKENDKSLPQEFRSIGFFDIPISNSNHLTARINSHNQGREKAKFLLESFIEEFRHTKKANASVTC